MKNNYSIAEWNRILEEHIPIIDDKYMLQIQHYMAVLQQDD